MKLKFTLSLLVVLSALQASYAQEYPCQKVLVEDLKLPPLSSSIGIRGIIGSEPANTPENSVKMGLAGAMSWNQRFEFAPTRQDAILRYLAFVAKEKDILMRPMMIIPAPNTAPEIIQALTTHQNALKEYKTALKTFNRSLLLARIEEDQKNLTDPSSQDPLQALKRLQTFVKNIENIEFLESEEEQESLRFLKNDFEAFADLRELNHTFLILKNIEAIDATRNILKKTTQAFEQMKIKKVLKTLKEATILSFETVDFDAPLQIKEYKFSDLKKTIFKKSPWHFGTSYLGDGGLQLMADNIWSIPLLRGVIRYEDLLDSNTVAKLEKEARKFEKKGYKIVFNKHPEDAIQRLIAQKRRDQGESDNRYSNADVVNETRERLSNGTAIEVAFEDADGVVKDGIVASINGNIVSPDTIYYDNINNAKITALALINVCNQMGMKLIDSQMVSKFTQGLKGKYISRDEFFTAWAAMPEADYVITQPSIFSRLLGKKTKIKTAPMIFPESYSFTQSALNRK